MNIPIAKLLSVLAILGIFGVIAGITAVGAQDSTDSHVPDYVRNYVPPTPEFTNQELLDRAMASRRAADSRAPVIDGTLLQMPDDAWNDGLIVKADFPPEIPDTVTVEPIDTPFYIVNRNGESATISKTTGRFQIGEGHQETFQFLIDQLDRDKMELIDSDFYEKRWGPFRDDALAEGKRKMLARKAEGGR